MERIGNIAICASAGTGKTFHLVNRYISLLAADALPSEIVALTFTRNAAGEIFSRIISRLLELIENPSSATDELKHTQKEKFAEILENLLLSLHKIQIGTLDSFFVKIITLFAFEFALPADITVVDERMQNYIKSKALKKALLASKNKWDMNDFVEEFKKATFGREEKRIFDLLENFVDDFNQDYLLSPEEEKWGKKENIFKNKNSFVHKNIEIGKFENENTILSRVDLSEKQRNKIRKLIETASKLIDFNPSIDISSSPNNFTNFFEAYEGLKRGSAEITIERKEVFFNEECPLLCEFLEYIAQRKIEKKLNETNGIYQIISRYEKIYDDFIRSSGIITFADLPFILSPNKRLGNTHFTLSASKERIEGDRLYIDYRLDSKFNHWLIDEFQDTSLSQWKIIENLIDEIVQDRSGRRSFFYVGDPKQAIYGWRGGLVELFDTVKEKYDELISSKELTQSYRSSEEVITTVNNVFLNLKDSQLISDELKGKWSFSKHKSRPENSPRAGKKGYCSLMQINEKEESVETKTSIILDIIKKIEPFKRGLTAAVLYRKNDNAAEIAQILQKGGVNTVIEGQSSICKDNPVVPAFLSLFKFSCHPGDEFSWQHLKMTPFALLLVEDKEEATLSILDRVQSCGFAKTIQYFKNALETRFKIGFDEFSALRIGQLMEAAMIFDSSGAKNCGDFINFIKEYKLSDSASQNAVQLMTIHKAKGLEFDIVFLLELKGKESILKDRLHKGLKVRKNPDLSLEALTLFPEQIITKMEPTLSEWAEELNLNAAYENLSILYVALTRAKEALYLIADPSSEKGESIHFQDILFDALSSENKQERLQNANLLYELGDPDWFEQWPQIEGKKEIKEDKEEKIKFDFIFESITPSSSDASNTSLSILLSDEAEKARQIGVCIHHLFEQIEWLENANINEIISKTRSELRFKFEHEILEESIRKFSNSIQSCDFRNELSKPKKNCELWREKSFSLILNGKFINGQFDRATIFKDEKGKPVEAVILDYKSDKIKAETNIDEYIEKHKQQLELYRKALSQLCFIRTEKISAKIAFASDGAVKGL